MVKNKLTIPFYLGIILVLCAGMFFSCSRPTNISLKREVQIPNELKQQPRGETPKPPEFKIPELVPVTQDVSPLKTRIVNVVARNTPLRDVLHVIADATSLNLIMEKGVNPEVPVTITLKNISAEEALNNILISSGYFYTIKENVLSVRAVDTRIFELGFLSVIQSYTIEVGGDIFGGVTGDISQAQGGTGGGGGTGMKGNITQNVKSDENAYKFWEAVEKSLGNIIGRSEAAQAGGETNEYFTINRVTGTIVVVATREHLERVEKYINTLKKIMSRQVLIEAKVIEITLSDGFKFGVDWTLVHRNLNVAGTRTTSSVTAGASGFNTVAPTAIGGPVFTIGGTAPLFGQYGGLTYVMNALEEQGELRVLSNPRISMMNGQTALLVVGRNESYLRKVETTTTVGTTTPVTTFTTDTGSVLSGLTIGIVPYINEYGEISLTITPIIAERVSFETKTVGAIGSQTEIKLPTVDLRELSTTVKVKDGELIIIGGLIKKTEKLNDNQVPFLGNVPLIGYIFKSRDKTESRTELVIALQPTLL